MGVYVYRITEERVMCSDGQEANVAVYAYKPTYCGLRAEQDNRRWHRDSGCTEAHKLARA